MRGESLAQVADLIRQGRSVIFDDTNYYSSMRHELLDIARAARIGYGLIHISTPVDVALMWNQRRAGPVPDSVVRKISEKFDTPGRRYSWDAPLLELDLSKMSVSRAVDLTLEHLHTLEHPIVSPPSSPLSPTHTARAEVQSDIADEAALYDVVTRRVVASYLSDHPEKRDRDIHSRIRREVLRTALSTGLSIEETERLLRRMLEESA